MSTGSTTTWVSADELRAIGEEVATAYLVDGREPAPSDPDGRRVLAAVALQGSWSGQVTLEVSAGEARDLTRRLVRSDVVSEADVVDAVGELVNVLGGNIKSLLVGESTLGIPTVTERGTAASALVELCRADLDWVGNRVDVRVWETPDQPVAGGGL